MRAPDPPFLAALVFALLVSGLQLTCIPRVAPPEELRAHPPSGESPDASTANDPAADATGPEPLRVPVETEWSLPNRTGEWILSSETSMLRVRPDEAAIDRLDPLTGQVLEERMIEVTDGLRPRQLVLAANLLVHLGKDSCSVAVYEASSGHLAWEAPSQVVSCPQQVLAARAGPLLLVATSRSDRDSGNRLVAYRVSNGEPVWARDFGPGSLDFLRVRGDRVHVDTEQGLAALDTRTGKVLWNTKTGWPRALELTGERLIYQSRPSMFSVVDAATHTPLGSVEIADAGPFASLATGPSAFAVFGYGHREYELPLAVVDFESITERWAKALPARGRVRPFVLFAGDKVLVFAGTPLIHVFDARDGTSEAPWVIPEMQQATPLSVGGADFILVDSQPTYANPPLVGTFQLRSLARLPEIRQVTVSGCANIQVDRRLCARPRPRVIIGTSAFSTDKKGCFNETVAAREALAIEVDSASILDRCTTTRAMHANGEYPCAFDNVLTLPLAAGVDDYEANVGLEQLVCQDP